MATCLLIRVFSAHILTNRRLTSVDPNRNWKLSIFLRSCRSRNSQAQTVFANVGHNTSERKYIPRSLRTPGTSPGGVNDRPLHWSRWNRRCETSQPRGFLCVENILEMFNSSRG